jgi:hypothetical protein
MVEAFARDAGRYIWFYCSKVTETLLSLLPSPKYVRNCRLCREL